jgi:hypothetical protein
MKLVIIVLLMFYSPSLTPTSEVIDDERDVEIVIETFFDGMKESSGDKIKSVLNSDATLQTVEFRDGEHRLIATDINRFIESVQSSAPGTLNEVLQSLTIKIDGNLAAAWMDYRFYLGTEFSHCGVNSMNLIKSEGNWRIFSIVDTRRKEEC